MIIKTSTHRQKQTTLGPDIVQSVIIHMLYYRLLGFTAYTYAILTVEALC